MTIRSEGTAPAGRPDPADPVALTRALIRCPSVTPADAGALDVAEAALSALGFACRRLRFEAPGTDPIDNLYARLGTEAPHLCFAGHTDVVPAGDRATWTVDPFAGSLVEGQVIGRGAVDMKGAVAAMIAAAAQELAESGPFAGSLSLLLTGDEEGPSVNGTVRVLAAMAAAGERWDACLVGEPTNPGALGDMIKIGRRGNLYGILSITGAMGHSAYPARSDNPLPKLVKALSALLEAPLDTGTDVFEPSHLALTSVATDTDTVNVTPGRAAARFNIRFNDRHTGASLERWLHERLATIGVPYQLEIETRAEAFLTPPGPWSDLVQDAAEAALGRRPVLSTSGGTSDARFIKDYCPVVEFGLVGQTMHKSDEAVPVAHLKALTAVYRQVLRRVFAAGPALGAASAG